MKTKKCKQCKEPFIPVRPLQYLCGFNCAAKRGAEQLKIKAQKELKKETKALQIKLKTLGEYKKEARVVFQAWIRKRDVNLPCISCGATNAKQWDGGHFYKAEVYTGLIFDENNCHKQCSRCNDLFSGNELAYREGLIKRYGEAFVKDLENRKDKARMVKYSKEDYEQFKNKYKEKLKQK